jgi:hypothetical protein
MTKKDNEKEDVKAEEKLPAKVKFQEVEKAGDDMDDINAFLAKHSGSGMEAMTADDFQIPRIGIVQSLSPQRNAQKDQYIEGCDEGQIFESVSKELWDGAEGVTVIPCYFQTVYLEWDTETRGSLVKNHGRDSKLHDETPPNKKKERITKDGTNIVKTAEYYLLLVDRETGSTRRCLLTMSKTALQIAKNWNARINTQLEIDKKTGKPFTVPMWSQAWNLTTSVKSNDNGTWFRWEIKPCCRVAEFENGKSLLREALLFKQQVSDGIVAAVDYEQDYSGSSVEEGDDDPM